METFFSDWMGTVRVVFTTTGFSGRIMNALIMTGPELEGHGRTAHSPFGQRGRPGQKRILRPHAAQILHLALASASLMAIFYSPDQPNLIKTKMIILLVVTTNLIQSQDRSMHASENPKRSVSVTRPPPVLPCGPARGCVVTSRVECPCDVSSPPAQTGSFRLKRPQGQGKGCTVHHGP
jgi:hypothetical protein